MSIQFDRRRLLEDTDVDGFKKRIADYLIQHGKASEDAAIMLAQAVADKVINVDTAIKICKATTGLGEMSSTGGGTTAGASFTPGTGEQHASPKAFKKKVEEDAPMLAHGKADISTYTQDDFKKVEAHAKLKSIEPKDLWGTKPTAMSEDENTPNIPSNVAKFAQRKGVTDVVNQVARWAEKKGKRIVGGTAIGKDYSTLILDLTHQGGEVRINTDTDEIEINDQDVIDYESFADAIDSLTDSLNENYHRFKRQTKERSNQDQYHEAIKAINKKLDEVNRILEFTSRMKEELSEGEETLEMKSRTTKTLDKTKTKVAEAYKKLKHLS